MFIVQGDPGQLQRAETTGDGSFAFSDEGTPAPLAYNAIGYNEADSYLYGIAVGGSGTDAIPNGSLVRIGEQGEVTRVGDQTYTHPGTDSNRFFSGAFNPADDLYYVSDSGPNTTMLALDVSNDGSIERTVELGENPGVQDFTFKDGYAWGGTNSGDLRRIDVETGSIEVFPGVLPTADGGYGAAWTFGNGNLGFSSNASGEVVQLEVGNSDSPSPDFEIISQVEGPSSSLNDGTSVPGLPADLGIEKTAASTFVSGDQISYDVTVENFGEGVSSGWTATDILPEGLSDPQFEGDGSPEIDEETGEVTVSGGRLAPGETRNFTVTATTDVPAGECISNNAQILGNEADPNADNNQDSVESCEGSTELMVEKTSDAGQGTQVGDTVEYTVSATNTGENDYTAENPAVLFDDISAVLDDASYNGDAEITVGGEPVEGLGYEEPLFSWSGPLAVGESAELTYSVTMEAAGDGNVRNVAWEPEDPEESQTPECDPATEEGLDPVTGEPCAVVEYDLPRATISKSADRTDLPAVGEEVTYSIEVSSEGPGSFTAENPASFADSLAEVLDDGTLVEGSLTSTSGEAMFDSEAQEITWDGALAAGENAVIEYSVAYTGDGDQQLDNVVCLPETIVLPGEQPCDTVEIPGAGLEQWKAVESSDDPVVAGSELTYTLFFENQGEAAATVDTVDDLTHVLDDASVSVEPSSETLDAPRDGERITISGEVAPGETATVTYQVTVNPDGERGDDIAANFLGEGPPPEDPECVPTDEQRPDCTVNPVGELNTWKSVDPASGTSLSAGDEATYTLHFENTGEAAVDVAHDDVLAGTLDDAEVTSAPVASDDEALEVSEIAEGRFTVSGELAAGATETVTYTVTVGADGERGDNQLGNFLVETGEEPREECEPAEGERADCTVNPVGELNTWKSVDPASGTSLSAGDEATYTLHFENTGEAAVDVAHDDVLAGTLDDAEVTSAPVASDDEALEVSEIAEGRFTVSGELAAGATETVTYTVTVGADGERGDNQLGNFLVETGEEPREECEPAEGERADCTVNYVSDVSVAKSSDPESGSEVSPGDEITYTLTFVNGSSNSEADPAAVDYTDHLEGVLDDAELTGRPEASSEDLTAAVDEDEMRISGQVPSGEDYTVSYSVTVDERADLGDGQLDNVVAVTGETPTCSDGSPLCTSHDVPPESTTPPPESDEEDPEPGLPGLPDTGAQGVMAVGIAAGLALLLGASMLLIKRRRS